MLWEYVCGGLGSNFHIPLYIDLGELVKIVTAFSYLVELRTTCIWGYIYIYIYYDWMVTACWDWSVTGVCPSFKFNQFYNIYEWPSRSLHNI